MLPDVSTRPSTLSAAAAIEVFEGVIVLAAGCYAGIQAIFGSPHDVASALVLCLMALAAGGGMAFAGWGLWHVSRWGRAPALLTQFFALIAAVSLIQSHQPVLGAVLAVVAVVGAAALLSPPTTRALVDQ